MSTLPPPPSPLATRLRQSSWLDPRLIIGVLLVVASTVVGAIIISGADNSVSRWAVANDLAAGSTLQASDLVVQRVRPMHHDPYVASSTDVVGKTLSREVRNGELLPQSAVSPEPFGVLATVGVSEIALSPAIAHGTKVDVWHSDNEHAGQRLLAGVTVESVVSSRGKNGLSFGTGTAQVTLRVDASQEQPLMSVVGKGELHLVALTGNSSPTPQPSSATTPHSDGQATTKESPPGSTAPQATPAVPPQTPKPSAALVQQPTAGPPGSGQ